MQTIGLFDAKTHFSQLIESIASGSEDEIIIARHGQPVARLLPIQHTGTERRIGIAAKEFSIPDDIDVHNDEVAKLFLGQHS